MAWVVKRKGRDSVKYPALDRRYNTKARRYIIETDYISGVKDSDGNQVIRPLDEKEKEWLNQFYTESVNADFYKDPRIKEIKEIIKELIFTTEVEDLIEQYRNSKNPKFVKETKMKVRDLKKENRENSLDLIEALEDQIQDVLDEVNLFPSEESRVELYRENYLRNQDLFNLIKRTGKMINLDLEEYDKFTSRRVSGIDAEHLLIESIEGNLDDEED